MENGVSLIVAFTNCMKDDMVIVHDGEGGCVAIRNFKALLGAAGVPAASICPITARPFCVPRCTGYNPDCKDCDHADLEAGGVLFAQAQLRLLTVLYTRLLPGQKIYVLPFGRAASSILGGPKANTFRGKITDVPGRLCTAVDAALSAARLLGPTRDCIAAALKGAASLLSPMSMGGVHPSALCWWTSTVDAAVGELREVAADAGHALPAPNPVRMKLLLLELSRQAARRRRAGQQLAGWMYTEDERRRGGAASLRSRARGYCTANKIVYANDEEAIGYYNSYLGTLSAARRNELHLQALGEAAAAAVASVEAALTDAEALELGDMREPAVRFLTVLLENEMLNVHTWTPRAADYFQGRNGVELVLDVAYIMRGQADGSIPIFRFMTRKKKAYEDMVAEEEVVMWVVNNITGNNWVACTALVASVPLAVARDKKNTVRLIFQRVVEEAAAREDAVEAAAAAEAAAPAKRARAG